MKTKFLAGCALAAASVIAFSGAASAATYSYTGVSVPIGVTATVTPPVEGAYVGQIKLTGAPSYPDAYLYCLDLFNNLAGSGTFNLSIYDVTGGATIPHAASDHSDLTLSSSTVQKIAALIYHGFDGSLGAPNTQANRELSAATQLAIWQLEYGAVSLSGVSGGLLANITADVTALLGHVATAGADWLSTDYLMKLYVPLNTSSQDLAFATVDLIHHTTDFTTPLPGALPLFVSGLTAMGLMGWRRKKRKTSAIAT